MSKADAFPIPANSCLNCRYSGAPGPDNPSARVCRYYPPKVSLGPQQNALTGQVGMATYPLWPPVSQHDWCSKFGPRLNT